MKQLNGILKLCLFFLLNLDALYSNNNLDYSLGGNFPECTPPSNVQIVRFDQEKIELDWQGPDAIAGKVQYVLRYRFILNELVYPWREIQVKEGHSGVIQNLKQDHIIEIELKKVCFEDDVTQYHSEWIQVLKRSVNSVNNRGETTNSEACAWLLSGSLTQLPDQSYKLNLEYHPLMPRNSQNPWWHFLVRYKGCTSNAQYQTFIINPNDSFAIIPPVEKGICEIAVRVEIPSVNEWCAWKDIIVDPNNNLPPSPPCGSGNVFVPSGTDPLPAASVGDVFYVSGLPFVLTEVVGSSGIFSGKGLLSFPFGDKKLKVTFSSITVNTYKQVIDGEVHGVQGTLTCHKTKVVSGASNDICVTKPNGEGWNSDGTYGASGLTTDPFGFDKSGKFSKKPPYDGYEEGMPFDENFDPNGFDSNGNHRETGDKYGPTGCSREGVDRNGNKCDPSGGNGPYYWLNGGGSSTEGLKLLGKVGDSLRINVLLLLDELEDEMDLKLTAINIECAGFRATLDQHIGPLNGTFIKGEAGEFYAEEMSKNFSSPPKELCTKEARRAGQEIMEKAHVDLYECDVKYMKIKNAIELIISMKTAPNLDELIDDIKDKIKSLNKAKAEELADDNDLFLEWLKSNIKILINLELPGTFASKFAKKSGFNFDPFESKPYNEIDFETGSIASIDNFKIGSLNLENEINFQLKNGSKIILGKHKALWYDELIDLNSFSLLGEDCDNLGENMPVAVTREIFEKKETVFFDNIIFSPSSATADVYYVAHVGPTGDKIVFQAQSISFGAGGLIGSFKLRVLEDFSFRINNSTLLKLNGTSPNTYVEIDCKGLKEISISGLVEFCRNFLTPIDPTSYEPVQDQSKKVTASFQVTMPSWGNFWVTISVEPFALTNAMDNKFMSCSATLDYSDLSSPAFTFPPNYGSAFQGSNGGPTPQWKGVYIKEIGAIVPSKFRKPGSPPLIVGAKNLIFDGLGLTGSVFAANVVGIDEGNIGGWALSIDTLSIDIVKNSLTGGSMSGLINVPTFTENLGYSAKIHANDKYEFLVKVTGELTANLWVAKARILPNSSISIGSSNGDFSILATLHGSLDIDGSLGGMALKVPNIDFEGVQVGNKDPYFSPGVWTCKGSAGIKFSGFEVSATNMTLVKGESTEEAYLAMDVLVTLTDLGGKNDISANAKLQVQGKLIENGDRQKWGFKKLHVTGVEIKGDIAGNTLSGYLIFYNGDGQFGTGFKGGISATFKGVADINAFATFGMFPTYKYFFVDAMVMLENPIGMGAMALHGLGGGLYNHMTRTEIGALKAENYDPAIERSAGDAPSGVAYIPNPGAGLGFRATLAISSSVKEAFNGNVTFEMNFNAGGGISLVSLSGNARFMEDLEFTQAPSKSPGNRPNSAPISANFEVKYDFNTDIFDGSLEVFANVGDMMKGSGANGKMVDAKIYFGGGNWYIHVGTPSAPCGVKFGLPGIGTLAESKTYLCIGKEVPAMKTMASRGFKLPDPTSGGRTSGTGFAFGSEFAFGPGEKTFLMFYAKLKLEFGFDMMVGKYSNVFCSNTSSDLGINGWYAQGQAFAKVNAGVGIKVKVFGKRKDFHAFDFNAAVGMVAKLPNPFYAAGVISGSYSVLGGVVKGKCNFKFEIGEQCLVSGGNPTDLDAQIIVALRPEKGETDVLTSSIPEFDLLYPLDQSIAIPSDEDPSKTEKFQLKVKYVKLIDKTNKEIPGKIIKTADGSTVQYKPLYFMPAHDSITFEISIDLFKDGIFDANETRKVSFKTGVQPDVIPEGNILSSYPIKDQKYFYQKEYYNGKGFILLDFGQPELFSGASQNDIIVRFKTGGQIIVVPSSYDFAASEVSFNIPTLPNNADCSIELVDNRKSTSMAGAPPDGKVLCRMDFHTSQYDLFKDKLLAYVASSTLTNPNGNYNFVLNSNPSEGWSDQEISNKWINVSFNLEKNDWYVKHYVPDFLYYTFDCLSESNKKRIEEQKANHKSVEIKLENNGNKLEALFQSNSSGFVEGILEQIELSECRFKPKTIERWEDLYPKCYDFPSLNFPLSINGDAILQITYGVPYKPVSSKNQVNLVTKAVN